MESDCTGTQNLYRYTKPILMYFIFHTGTDAASKKGLLKSYQFLALDMPEVLMGCQAAMSYG